MTEDQTPPMSRPRVAAGALFVNDQGDVLLVKPTYKDGWDIPGGYVEPGETPIEACRREVSEELGLDVQITKLLAVDWAPSPVEGDKVLFIFDGGPLSEAARSELVLPADELETSAFQRPMRLDSLMPARLARRVRAALEARSEGILKYLEHGATPTI